VSIGLETTIRYRPAYGHLAALCLGGILLTVHRTLLYPMLDTVAAELGLTAAQVGSVASVYFVCLLTSQIALSFYGDRIGLKRVLVVAYVLAGIAVAGMGWWTRDYATLMLFVGFNGLMMGIFWPIGYSLAVVGVPDDQIGLATGIVGAGLAGGSALGPALAGLLFNWMGSWRMPFVLLAIPTVALGLAFIVLLKESPPVSSQSQRASWIAILRDRNLVMLFAASFCALYAFWTILVWGPAFLQAERGMSLANSGLYIALATVMAVPAGLLLGPLSDRIGRRRISWIVFLFSGAALALSAVVQNGWLLAVVLVIFGLTGKFAWDPVQVAWLADLVRQDRTRPIGQVVATSSIIAMTSSIIGPVVNGWIRDQTGSLRLGFFIGAALAVAGAVLCATVRDVKRL
jgi:MFS family permease